MSVAQVSIATGIPSSRRRGHSLPRHESASQSLARDSLMVVSVGQFGRVLGILTALSIRWGLTPALLGVYSGLRIALDHSNRASLGIGLGAVQQIPILRGAGRYQEANHLAAVARGVTAITSVLYALGLLAWALICGFRLSSSSLSAEWSWGFLFLACMVPLHRHVSFQVALLRCCQQFHITSLLEVVEALASVPLTLLGLWLWGFWGLIGSVGAILALKAIVLELAGPAPCGWAWDLPLVIGLIKTGLPIFVATSAFGFLVSLDRILILWLLPDGARAAGLYSVALLGANWTLDVSGRVVSVLYPHFQTTLGRTSNPLAVASLSMRSTRSLAWILSGGCAAASLLLPSILLWLLPAYEEGLSALQPMLPGMLFLGLSAPARHALLALGKTWRLSFATIIAAGVIACLSLSFASEWGLPGIAWSFGAGALLLFVLVEVALVIPFIGPGRTARHLLTLAVPILWALAGVMLVRLSLPGAAALHDLLLRAVSITAWCAGALALSGGRELRSLRDALRRPRHSVSGSTA